MLRESELECDARATFTIGLLDYCDRHVPWSTQMVYAPFEHPRAAPLRAIAAKIAKEAGSAQDAGTGSVSLCSSAKQRGQ